MYIIVILALIGYSFTKKTSLSLNQTNHFIASQLKKMNVHIEKESVSSLLSFIHDTFLRTNLYSSFTTNSTTSSTHGLEAVYKNDTGIMMAYQYIQRQIDSQNITLVYACF